MKNFSKKDLRTGDRVTIKDGSDQYITMIGTAHGDLFVSTVRGWMPIDEYNEDLTFSDDDDFTVVKVGRPRIPQMYANHEYEVIWERSEKLPYNAWYTSDDFGGLLFYTDERQGYGLKANGHWFESNKLMALNCGNMKAIPTEKWQERLVEYAKSQGYLEGVRINYEGCIGEIIGDLYFAQNVMLSVLTKGSKRGNPYFPILDTETGEWTEIVEQDSEEELLLFEQIQLALKSPRVKIENVKKFLDEL